MGYLRLIIVFIWIVSFLPVYSQVEAIKASSVESDKFGTDSVSKVLEQCKLFKASEYSPKEYEAAVERNKLFMGSLQEKGSSKSPEELSKEVIDLARTALEKSLLPHLKERKAAFGQSFQESEVAFAESLATPQYLKSKDLHSESDILLLELTKRTSAYEKLTGIEKESAWKEILGSSEVLLKKIEQGLDLSEKAKKLSLSQVDQLIAASTDLDSDLVVVSFNAPTEEVRKKAETYRSQITEYVKVIESGKVKEGYQKIESLRLDVGVLVTETLAPKAKTDIASLKERIKNLDAKFSEIEVNLEDEDFTSSYQLTKDSLSAAKESMQFALDFETQERYGEALLQVEEAGRLVYLVEEDMPGLQRKQSHILKKKGTQSSEEKKESAKGEKEDCCGEEGSSDKKQCKKEDSEECCEKEEGSSGKKQCKKEDSEECCGEEDEKPTEKKEQADNPDFPEIEQQILPTKKTTKRNTVQPKEASIYRAKPKDTLSGIAKKHYGKSSLWKKIHRSNKDIKNPNRIYPKQKIRIPALTK